jgi:NitT/TauT family transport system permease protein
VSAEPHRSGAVDGRPVRAGRHNVLLALLPFIVVAAVYLFASHQRLAENPHDKLLPSLGQMADAIDRFALTPDPQTGDYRCSSTPGRA